MSQQALNHLDFLLNIKIYPRNGVVVRASASQSVDLEFIPFVESYQKTLKNGIHSFPAWRSAFKGCCVEQACKFAYVSLGRALNKTFTSSCGRQVAQFSLSRKDWWQEGHSTVKQVRSNKNADQKSSALATPNRQEPKNNNNNSISKYPLYSVKLVFVGRVKQHPQNLASNSSAIPASAFEHVLG